MNHEHLGEEVPGEPQHEPGRSRLTPRIWVASLADVNDGVLHGDWLDAARDPEDLDFDIQTILARSPWSARTGHAATDWAVFDAEHFGPIRTSELTDISWTTAVAYGVRKHGLAYAAWANHTDEPDQLRGFDAAYLGHYDSLHAYLEQLVNDLGYNQVLDDVVPPSIRPWVKLDIAATARDLEAGGDVFTEPADIGGVWVFDAR